MIHIINNILDLLWILAGGIAVVVLIAIFIPWRFVYELIVLTLLVILIAVSFWIREAWRVIRKIFKKRSNWVHIDDHALFI